MGKIVLSTTERNCPEGMVAETKPAMTEIFSFPTIYIRVVSH